MKRKFTLLITALMLLFANAMTAFGQVQYEKVTSAPTDWSGEYLLVWEKSADSAYVWTGVDAVNCYSYSPINSNKITATQSVTITIASMDGGYSVKINGGTNDGKYISHSANSNGLNTGTTAAAQTLSYSDNSVIMKNAGNAVMRFNKTSNQMRFRFYKAASYANQQPVQLYKKISGGNQVATPTFSPAGGTYSTTQNVTISCSTADAIIYYTTDGSTPTTSSSVYSSALAVSTTTTIKAMAVKSGMTNSEVATATYTFPTLITIAEARALDNDQYALVQGIVTFIDGSNVYVQDETAGIDLYLNNGTVPSTLALGDKVKAYGKKSVYKNLVELSGINGGDTSVFSIVSTGNALPVAVKTIAEINANGLNSLQSTRIKVEKAKIGAINTSGNTTLTQGEKSAIIYKIPALSGIAEGDSVNVTAVISCYNTIQLRVALASDVEKQGGTTSVATPTFTPVEGTYTETQTVTIACATDGATIRYTLDGTDPTETSTVYTETLTISETTTIKAKAWKTGMDASNVASATYTITPPAQETAYTLITGANGLVSGDKYILVGVKNDTLFYALGKQNTNNRASVTVTRVGNVITTTPAATSSESAVYELTLGQDSTGYWTLYDAVNGGYLYAAHSSSNYLKTQSTNDANGVWTIDIASTGAATIKAQGTNTRNWLRFNGSSKIFSCYASGQADVYLYKAGEIPPAGNVATPTFTPAEGTYISNQTVTIACETEGATIRYTLDGTDPTEQSTEYTEAIAVSETTTVKAKAWKAGMDASAVASATYTIPSLITFAEARSLENNEYGLVEGIVTFIDGRNVYAQDSTAGIDLYLNANTIPATLAAGDKVRAYGKRAAYKGLVELSGIDGSNANVFTVVSTGNPLPLTVKTIEEINNGATGNIQSTRVKIESATIGTINTSGNTTLTQGENTINVYKIPELTGIEENDVVNVTSIISYYNSVQLRVAAATDVAKANAVETPTFTPETAQFLTSQLVTISCGTEDASIYYTIDGTTPTTESTLYSEPFTVTETTTVKAIAVKAGLNASNVAEATYTKLTISTIADARALAIDEYAAIEGVVTFIDGRNIFVQDETAGIVAYLNSNTIPDTLAIGQKVRAYGKRAVYKGLVELSGINGGDENNFLIVSSGNPLPEAVVKTIEEVNTDFAGDNMLQSTRVQIVEARIGEINTSGNTPIRQGANTLNLYKMPEVEGMIQGDFVTVTGIVACFNTVQLRINEASDVSYYHAPTLSTEPSSLAGLNYNIEEGPSEDQVLVLNGEYLKSTVFVRPSENFEISTAGGESFHAENEIGINGGTTITNFNVYVRLKAGLALGTYSESIVCTATDADTVYVAVSGQVREVQTASDYTRIASLSQLTDGMKVIFAARYNTVADSYYAMTAQTSGKPTGVMFTSVEGENETLPTTISDADTLYYWTVGVSGTNYTFTNAEGNVLGYTSGTNFATGGANTAWTIEYGTSDTASMVPSYSAFVVTNGNSTGRAIALNNAATRGFGAYSKSNMTGSNASSYNFYLDMFAMEGGTPVCATPSFTPEAGTYYAAQTVTIACGTEDATIHYTLDGTEPTAASTAYTAPITVSESVTIKALAIKEGYENSDIAVAEYTIIIGATTIFNQDWEGDMNGWTFVTVTGSKPWTVASNSGNHYAYANGYNGGINEQWCISPAFNLNNYSDVTLTFKNAKNYTGPDVQLYISSNYNGSTPATATWTELTFTKSEGSWAWTESGSISLSSFSGTNCYIGYKYTTTETQAAAWEIDDIMLVGFTSSPILTATPSALSGFAYAEGHGPSAEQSLIINGVNLTSDVTIWMNGSNFDMSTTSGENFTIQPSITLTPTAGAVNQTIYVRMTSDLAVGTYTGSITIESQLDDITVSLAGEVSEEGESWNRIYSLSDLENGAKVIIAARYNTVENEYYAMTAATSGKPEGVLFTSVTEGATEMLPESIALSETTYSWTVSIDGDNYTFTNNAGDVMGYGGSGTNFATGGDNTDWTITYTLSDTAAMVSEHWGFLITNVNYETRGFALNSNYVFGPYSTQNLTGGNASTYNFILDLFVQGGEVTPTVMTPIFNYASGTYYEAIDVEISCSTDDATIYYTTDGTDPDASSDVYTSAIHVDNDMTIKAIAMKEGYDNSGIAMAEYVINDDIVIIFNQDWEDGMNGWTFETFEGNKPWTIASYSGNQYANANGYGDDVDNEQWCISPEFNLNTLVGQNPTLTFMNATKFNGPALELLFANDYDGQDPTAATWQPIEFTMSAGNYEWTSSGEISLNGFSGSICNIAFKYTSTPEAAAAWEIDDIMLYATPGTDPYIIPSAYSMTGFEYEYELGPSATQSFTLTAGNLVGEGAVTVTASEYFRISLDEETWATELSLEYADGQLVGQPVTVYVRMKCSLEIGEYEGAINVAGGDAECEITLAGEVFEPTGLTENFEENISIYSGKQVIFIKNDMQSNLSMIMYNIIGQPVMTMTITAGDNRIEHNFSDGAYIIRLTDGSNVMSRKVVLR